MKGLVWKEEENLTPVKEVNSAPPKDALMEVNHVNDENWKKEKENLQDEGHKQLEKAKNNDNKVADIR